MKDIILTSIVDFVLLAIMWYYTCLTIGCIAAQTHMATWLVGIVAIALAGLAVVTEVVEVIRKVKKLKKERR